ncbi:MAG: hypothetical protein GWP05_08290, partial [Anaerolineaceae bacterium]|nr:hypothetical protein [Anaerolineaceae bacterium]
LFAATNRCCPSKFLIPRRSDLEALCSLLPGRGQADTSIVDEEPPGS